MILVFIFVLMYSVSRHFDLSFMAATRGCEWWALLTYSLVHLSFLHLVTNSAMLLMYYPLVRDRYGMVTTVAVTLPTVFLSTFLFTSDAPTFGASGIVFSLFGMYLAYLWRNKVEGRTRYTLTLLGLMSFQSIIGHGAINWQIHFSSLFISFMACVILTRY